MTIIQNPYGDNPGGGISLPPDDYQPLPSLNSMRMLNATAAMLRPQIPLLENWTQICNQNYNALAKELSTNNLLVPGCPGGYIYWPVLVTDIQDYF